MLPELPSAGNYLDPSGIKKGFLISFILTVGIGAVNFGYSLGVFNSMMVDFLNVFEIADKDVAFWKGAVTSICSLGCAFGSLFRGPLGPMLGKKRCIHLANLLLIIGCALPIVEINGKNLLALVMVGRFIYGMSTGAFSVFVPSYINELTPVELRGPFGTATQILMNSGILISNLVGLPFPDSNDNPYRPGTFINDNYWRVVIALPIPMALIQSLLLMTVFNYETPRFLL